MLGAGDRCAAGAVDATGTGLDGNRANRGVSDEEPEVGHVIRMRYDLATMRRTRLLRLPIGL
jgi:hypothetical protein